MKRILLIVVVLVFPLSLSAQSELVKSKLSFNGDFRFRVEQDWDSKKADGTLRNDRTRLRYRLRAGVSYKDKWYETGFRIRTGNPNKQQDPQLTLGEGAKEFGTLPIGLEKAYFEGHWHDYKFWVGKQTFSFKKNNELFWSDNVYPEGVFLEKGFQFDAKGIDTVGLRAGHYIVSASGESIGQDAYFQGIQTYMSFFGNRFELFPSFYQFRNLPNIPDGDATFELDYTIFHLGTSVNLMQKPMLGFEFDYYHNFQDYKDVDLIASDFKEQKSGAVVALVYGQLKQKGDYLFEASYAYLQQYSIVDFLAQNDWARWDYSSFMSPDGRLSNFNGIELVAGYKIDKKTSLKMKYYLVEQLISYGDTNETGSRIRLDLDVKF